MWDDWLFERVGSRERSVRRDGGGRGLWLLGLRGGRCGGLDDGVLGRNWVFLDLEEFEDLMGFGGVLDCGKSCRTF